jgi:hypothetical protein
MIELAINGGFTIRADNAAGCLDELGEHVDSTEEGVIHQII